ncbi:MAG: DUF1800 domain-containing protein [Sphingomonas sp.]
MSAPLSLSSTSIALNRFGLGARPGEAVPADPKRWLVDQFDRFDPKPAGFAALPDAAAVLRDYQKDRRELRRVQSTAATDAAKDKQQRDEAGRDLRSLYQAGVDARAESALVTDAPFVERLVHFWANHFCISADNARVTAYAAHYERDAIRPHVLGRFEDMLVAVEQHPAMLFYLNQANSIGPNSPAARRADRRDASRRAGLNENLGRETMELHTLGVRSGYAQADVTEYSRALTGWTVDAGPRGNGGFLFRPAFHEPGSRTIMGKTYDQQGERQALAALGDFARSPKTADHIATKLARHFAGDDPPPALVARLSETFRRTNGSLPDVYRTLIDSPEPWAPQPLKFKTPWEWTISAWRGLGRRQIGKTNVYASQRQLGQPTWKPGSPAGWDDIAASWAGPDALYRRVDFAARMTGAIGDRVDARTLAPKLLPGALSPATAEQLARAESPATALALLLVSPDFLRR